MQINAYTTCNRQKKLIYGVHNTGSSAASGLPELKAAAQELKNQQSGEQFIIPIFA